MVNNHARGRTVVSFAASAITIVALSAGCAADDGNDSSGAGATDTQTVSIENCGKKLTFPSPAKKIYVNEGQMLLTLFALEADDRIAAVSGIRPSRIQQFKVMYGEDRIAKLPIKSDGAMTLETILALRPDVVMAGHGWGFSVERNITPERLLDEFSIPAYTYTPTCLPGTNPNAKTMGPWDEAFLDLTNTAEITGQQDEAKAVIAKLKERKAALEAAPQATKKPSIMYATTISSEGASSAGRGHMYQAVIDAAGAVNAFAKQPAKSLKVSWETVTAAKPDVLVVTDTGDGRFKEKMATLRSHPATKNLQAVTAGRIVKIPTDMGRSGALLMDSAEVLRQQLETLGFLPESGIKPQMDLSALD